MANIAGHNDTDKLLTQTDSPTNHKTKPMNSAAEIPMTAAENSLVMSHVVKKEASCPTANDTDGDAMKSPNHLLEHTSLPNEPGVGLSPQHQKPDITCEGGRKMDEEGSQTSSSQKQGNRINSAETQRLKASDQLSHSGNSNTEASLSHTDSSTTTTDMTVSAPSKQDTPHSSSQPLGSNPVQNTEETTAQNDQINTNTNTTTDTSIEQQTDPDPHDLAARDHSHDKPRDQSHDQTHDQTHNQSHNQSHDQSHDHARDHIQDNPCDMLKHQTRYHSKDTPRENPKDQPPPRDYTKDQARAQQSHDQPNNPLRRDRPTRDHQTRDHANVSWEEAALKMTSQQARPPWVGKLEPRIDQYQRHALLQMRSETTGRSQFEELTSCMLQKQHSMDLGDDEDGAEWAEGGSATLAERRGTSFEVTRPKHNNLKAMAKKHMSLDSALARKQMGLPAAEERVKLEPRSAFCEVSPLLQKSSSGLTQLEMYLLEKEQQIAHARRWKKGDGLEPRLDQYQKHALLESRDEQGFSVLELFLNEKAADQSPGSKGKCSERCVCKNQTCTTCKPHNVPHSLHAIAPITQQPTGLEATGYQVQQTREETLVNSPKSHATSNPSCVAPEEGVVSNDTCVNHTEIELNLIDSSQNNDAQAVNNYPNPTQDNLSHNAYVEVSSHHPGHNAPVEVSSHHPVLMKKESSRETVIEPKDNNKRVHFEQSGEGGLQDTTGDLQSDADALLKDTETQQESLSCPKSPKHRSAVGFLCFKTKTDSKCETTRPGEEIFDPNGNTRTLAKHERHKTNKETCTLV